MNGLHEHLKVITLAVMLGVGSAEWVSPQHAILLGVLMLWLLLARLG